MVSSDVTTSDNFQTPGQSDMDVINSPNNFSSRGGWDTNPLPSDGMKSAISENATSLVSDSSSVGLGYNWANFGQIGPMFAGSVASSVIKGATDYENQSNLISASQGTGPNGHAFDAMAHANAQANYQSGLSTAESAIVSAGSIFGPEGLGVGLAVAGAVGVVGSFFSPSEDTTQASDGSTINAASTI